MTLLIASQQKCSDPAISELSQQLDVSTRYDDTADRFDTEVGFSEWLMGLLKIRKELAGKCKGHVLEVSCGTGRNLGYFNILNDGDVESLTFIDLSPQMIGMCKKKWSALYSGREAELRKDLIVRFMTGSAAERMPLAPVPAGGPPKKYDAIIQTMGLCSTPAPVALLANLARHLDTANPDARIYLLEHGRSYREWLNNILDGHARKHAEIHGCWFNRDIGTLVADAAAQCDLEIVWEKRHHIGTTWVFELKPKKVAAGDSVVVEDRRAADEKSSWLGWAKGAVGA